MAGYVTRRLLQAVPILFGVAIISFALVHLSPGDPIDRFRTPTVRPEQLEGLVRLYGLDRPLYEQFWSWITTYVQIWRPEAWGYSFLDGQPVIHKIAERLPATLLLGGTALLLTVAAGHPARHPGRRQAVQLGRSRHQQRRHGRLRHPVLPARALPALLRRRRARLVPALRDGDVRQRGRPGRHRLAPRPAGRQPRPAAGGRLVALRARRHARGPAPGLRAHRARQGPAGSARDVQARAAQRDHPGHHPRRADDPDPARRRRDHRGDLQLARASARWASRRSPTATTPSSSRS